jgi:hypothetical protein
MGNHVKSRRGEELVGGKNLTSAAKALAATQSYQDAKRHTQAALSTQRYNLSTIAVECGITNAVVYSVARGTGGVLATLLVWSWLERPRDLAHVPVFDAFPAWARVILAQGGAADGS